jgi:hypothetical protein
LELVAGLPEGVALVAAPIVGCVGCAHESRFANESPERFAFAVRVSAVWEPVTGCIGARPESRTLPTADELFPLRPMVA